MSLDLTIFLSTSASDLALSNTSRKAKFTLDPSEEICRYFASSRVSVHDLKRL